MVIEPSQRARALILIIPGNPGMPVFYTGYGEQLCTRLCAEVVILGYAGHLTRSSYATIAVRLRSYALAEQQAHFDASCREYSLRAAALGVPLIILGHSIGAYLALGSAQALRAHDELMSDDEHSSRPKHAKATRGALRARDKPSPAGALTPPGECGGVGVVEEAGAPHVVALFPYLGNAPAMHADRRFVVKYMLLTWVGRLVPLIAAFVSLLVRLPRGLLTLVLGYYLSFAGDGTVALVADEVVSFGLVFNMLGLARDEVRLLAPPFDWAAVRHLVRDQKLRLLYCPNDEWAPVESLERARREGVLGELVHGVGHAFCTHKEHTRIVADWTVERFAHVVGLSSIAT